ncbi:hypothetical protein [Sessilibacter corallicola]|uniref:hypothetical protein n=1 Tax=Sessilibacter corallicola TaxID=2904075 RepID=UPI001E4A65EA|nr:hypothetical protein [Sessilibacter corallicola]MCE2029305.1 hypothetical protein [Sessilibacter corallicola]
MANSLSDAYGERATLPTPEYPNGSFKDRQSDVSRGTPVGTAWGDDFLGFLDSFLVAVGLAPSGSADTAINSQRFQVLLELIAGRGQFVSVTTNGSVIELSNPFPEQQKPQSYFDGMALTFRTDALVGVNTRINAFGLGNREILLSNGNQLNAQDLNRIVTIIYNAEQNRFEIPVTPSSRIVDQIDRGLLPGATSGLVGAVREATSAEAASRSSVRAYMRPNHVPRQATSNEVMMRLNSGAYITSDQLPPFATQSQVDSRSGLDVFLRPAHLPPFASAAQVDSRSTALAFLRPRDLPPFATPSQISNRFNVDAIPRPSDIPRQATNSEVQNYSNVTAFVAPDQLDLMHRNFSRTFAYAVRGRYTFNHGLGGAPTRAWIVARALVARDGYSVGQELVLSDYSSEHGAIILWTSTQITIQAGSDGIIVFGTNGNSTSRSISDFSFTVHAERRL